MAERLRPPLFSRAGRDSAGRDSAQRVLAGRTLADRTLADRALAVRALADRTLAGRSVAGLLPMAMLLFAALGISACGGAPSAADSPEPARASTDASQGPGEPTSSGAVSSAEERDRAGIAAGHRGVAQLDSVDDGEEVEEEPACMMGLDCNDHPLAGCDSEDFAVRYRARCVEGSCLYTEQRERCMEGTRCMETFAGARCVPHRSADGEDDDVPARAAIDFATRQLLINTSIRFDVASASIRPSADAILEEVASVLRDTPEVVIRIEGHTDDTGSPESNLRLSVDRAEAVRDALQSRGVSPARIRVRGHGQALPLVPNEGEWQREVNRRVEFHLVEEEVE